MSGKKDSNTVESSIVDLQNALTKLAPNGIHPDTFFVQNPVAVLQDLFPDEKVEEVLKKAVRGASLEEELRITFSLDPATHAGKLECIHIPTQNKDFFRLPTLMTKIFEQKDLNEELNFFPQKEFPRSRKRCPPFSRYGEYVL